MFAREVAKCSLHKYIHKAETMVILTYKYIDVREGKYESKGISA